METAITETLLSVADTTAMREMYVHLHMHPELSMQEHETANYIANQLDGLGIRNFRCGGTGVVGIIENGEGPVIAFRADSDGLPIKEDTGLEYASTATGILDDGTVVPVMHGCGHDTHVTALLTAAKLLSRELDTWSGTLVLVFQPGEETAAGAKAMVDDGLWDRAPRPSVVLGQHVMPGQAGEISISSGTAMAMADALRITVFGRQSHGSQPQSSIDPIVLGAHMITRLQTIVSRELDPMSPAVVTSGTFHAGLKENIIPDRAEFTLNIRTFTQDVRDQVLAAITRIVQAEALASNAPAPVIEEIYTFPRCYNDPETVTQVARALRGELGEHAVHDAPPMMGSEDFGHLADSIGVPSAYWMFGGFDLTKGTPPVNHSPFFGPEIEPTLTTGVRAAVSSLRSFLGGAR